MKISIFSCKEQGRHLEWFKPGHLLLVLPLRANSGHNKGFARWAQSCRRNKTLNTVSKEDIQQYLESARVEIDKELDRLLPVADHFPPSIHQAMRYSVFAGGKRLRPILCLEAGRLLGGEERMLVRLGKRAGVDPHLLSDPRRFAGSR